MNAAWIRFRRLVASLMLVAMTSFVLHSGAMASLHQHGSGSSNCDEAASAGHIHQAATIEKAHDHGDDITHHHDQTNTADGVTSTETKADLGAKAPCCASVCAIVLTSFDPAAPSAPIIAVAMLLPESQRASGIGPNGLKRPPRTPNIA